MKKAYKVYTKFLPPDKLMLRKVWCEENIGARQKEIFGVEGAWDLIWLGPQKDYGTGYMWKFREEKDAVLFALKWT